ncbi:hypothetical protein HY409_02195 [Candidatus Gottesmanbacteria bacterium]|nr:hypothetical protein [Candidatus Gottesmanbacteria bacterium]
MENYLAHRVSPKTSSFISLIALLFFLPLLLLGTYQTAVLISRASGKAAKITVNTKAPLEEIKTDFYHAFAQGGEESTDMLSPILSEVSALKPKLIRLDHIYDHYDVVNGSEDNLSFDFAGLDRAIDTILATGAKPLLSLSFMPSVIAKEGVIINPPRSWDRWAEVVKQTIERYSGKNGKNISGVYYEVWNEPDLDQFGSWKMGGEKSYLQLYRYAAIGAGRAQNVNLFYLGGPGTTGLYKNWILGLVTSGNRVDFLSWHSYLKDPLQFDRDQKNLITWLQPYPQYAVKQKLITEFGFTGAKDKRYGTAFGAAHTAAVIRQLISGGPTYLFSFQLKDGPGQEDGSGWGLVTHESNGKRIKPRYNIYSLLDNMAGTRLLLTGEGTWVTGFASIKGSSIQVLLVNFDPTGSHSETTPVTFTNLDPGSYTYKQKYTPSSIPSVSLADVQIKNGTYLQNVLIPAQSIAFLQLTKK